jgi:hypothetical protein
MGTKKESCIAGSYSKYHQGIDKKRTKMLRAEEIKMVTHVHGILGFTFSITYQSI